MTIETQQQKKSDWILIAKGIGILLVVIGHFYIANLPNYWVSVRNIIYLFHMPLFFILSGFLYSHQKYPYLDLIKNKFKRLMLPFISIALLFFVIKFVFGLFFKLDFPVNINSIYALLTNTPKSYMPLLWFVYTLFLIFITYPLLRVFINNYLLMAILVMLNAVIGEVDHVLGMVVLNLPYFIFGVMLKESTHLEHFLLKGNLLSIFISLMLFVLFYLLFTHHNIQPDKQYYTVFLFGLLGALTVMNISKDISMHKTKFAVIISSIGFYSMTIYLFHTLFESAVRIFFYQVAKNLSLHFLLIALIAVVAGVVFPLLLEKWFLRKYTITRKYLLGM